MTCKGICGRLEARKPKKGGRYRNGQKRCKHCEKFFETVEIYCECCGTQLRNGPRNSKLKEKLRLGVLA